MHASQHRPWRLVRADAIGMAMAVTQILPGWAGFSSFIRWCWQKHRAGTKLLGSFAWHHGTGGNYILCKQVLGPGHDKQTIPKTL